VDKDTGFDLLNPHAPPLPPIPKRTLKDLFKSVMQNQKVMVAELKVVCETRRIRLDPLLDPISIPNFTTAMKLREMQLTDQTQLNRLAESVTTKYKDVFGKIPHIDELPTDIYC
jgi:hypothetical protein